MTDDNLKKLYENFPNNGWLLDDTDSPYMLLREKLVDLLIYRTTGIISDNFSTIYADGRIKCNNIDLEGNFVDEYYERYIAGQSSAYTNLIDKIADELPGTTVSAVGCYDDELENKAFSDEGVLVKDDPYFTENPNLFKTLGMDNAELLYKDFPEANKAIREKFEDDPFFEYNSYSIYVIRSEELGELLAFNAYAKMLLDGIRKAHSEMKYRIVDGIFYCYYFVGSYEDGYSSDYSPMAFQLTAVSRILLLYRLIKENKKMEVHDDEKQAA